MTTETVQPTEGTPDRRPLLGRREDAHTRWTEIKPTKGLRRLDLRELWDYRELAAFLALRDLKVRYKQAALGVMWAVIQPLATAALFTVIFGRLVSVPSQGLPYVVFAFSGMACWIYISSGVDGAAKSLVEDRELVTKVYFPRILAPGASLAPGLLDFAITLVPLAIICALNGVAPSAAILLLPVAVVVLFLVALGIGLWLSALNVRYRDVRHLLAFGIQTWFYASPIVYPPDLIGEPWRYVYALNPVVGAIELFRWVAVGGANPGPECLVSLASGLVLLIGGIRYFTNVERKFADII